MVRAIILGHGTICVDNDITEVSIWSKENLSVPELKEVDDEPFNPTVVNLLSPLLSGVQTGTAEEGTLNKLTVQLGGFSASSCARARIWCSREISTFRFTCSGSM